MRVLTIQGICRVMAVYWELIPVAVIKSLVTPLVQELVFDSSSAEVRHAVFKVGSSSLASGFLSCALSLFLSCALSRLFYPSLSSFSPSSLSPLSLHLLSFYLSCLLNYFSRWGVRLSLSSLAFVFLSCALSLLFLSIFSFYLSFCLLNYVSPFLLSLSISVFVFSPFPFSITLSHLFLSCALSPLSLHLSFYLSFCLLNYFSRWGVRLSLSSFYPALFLSLLFLSIFSHFICPSVF